MNDALAFSVHTVQWPVRAAELRLIRRAVFVVEQQVPEAEEWDGFDAVSRHVLALADAVPPLPIGTGRLLPDGHIGRMAVLKSWRGRGVGRALLAALLVLARQLQFEEVVLHAQPMRYPFMKNKDLLRMVRNLWKRALRTA